MLTYSAVQPLCLYILGSIFYRWHTTIANHILLTAMEISEVSYPQYEYRAIRKQVKTD